MFFKSIYTVEYMYIWPHIAIDTHVCSINALERCTQQFHGAVVLRKLVCTTPS